MSIVIIGLLVVIAVELGIIIYLVGGGGGLPWMVQAKDGLLSGRIAAPLHHRTLNAKLEYMMCASRFQTELEEQRFRAQQGLEPLPSGSLEFDAAPGSLKK